MEHPEKKIEQDIMEALRQRGWFVKKMHGSIYQAGFPDLFACHSEIGVRLIEVKLPGMVGSRFTRAQIKEFGAISRHGCGIWILTSVVDILKLAEPANWTHYL
jgi:Holliday junction resolvase